MKTRKGTVMNVRFISIAGAALVGWTAWAAPALVPMERGGVVSDPPLGNLNVRGRVAMSPKNRETVRRNGSKQS